MAEYQIVALSTCQFTWGGLFDSRPADHRIHLVRYARPGGTPGPTLCGIDRFAEGVPGFSMGGGVSDSAATPCVNCEAVADLDYPGLPVRSGSWEHLFEREASPWDPRDLPAIAWDSGAVAGSPR